MVLQRTCKGSCYSLSITLTNAYVCSTTRSGTASVHTSWRYYMGWLHYVKKLLLRYKSSAKSVLHSAAFRFHFSLRYLGLHCEACKKALLLCTFIKNSFKAISTCKLSPSSISRVQRSCLYFHSYSPLFPCSAKAILLIFFTQHSNPNIPR